MSLPVQAKIEDLSAQAQQSAAQQFAAPEPTTTELDNKPSTIIEEEEDEGEVRGCQGYCLCLPSVP